MKPFSTTLNELSLDMVPWGVEVCGIWRLIGGSSRRPVAIFGIWEDGWHVIYGTEFQFFSLSPVFGHGALWW